MGKIIVLVGSVRRDGNTELLAKSFVNGTGMNQEVELISVADYHIHPCIGCNYCFTSENNCCVQKDDMGKIYEKLMHADTVIIASPVYFYGISAQLKTLVDRLHTPMRSRFSIRKLGLILVGAATLPDLFNPILLQYQMVCRFFNLEDIGTVLVSGAKEKGDVFHGDGLKRAYELGQKLARCSGGMAGDVE